MAAHTFNSSTPEAKVGRSLSLRQPGLLSWFELHSETLSQKNKNKGLKPQSTSGLKHLEYGIVNL